MILTEVLKDIVFPIKAFHYRKEYYKWRATSAKKLLKYKDIHKGEDCFIIANGPSLKKMDLSPLNDYFTFALNRANLLFDLFDINFTYHVCVDDIVLKNIKDDLNNNAFGCTSFIAEGIIQDSLVNKSHIEKLFLGGPWTFYKNICQPIHTGNTVTYTAMQIAYFMGFKRVFLVGVDHSWQNIGKAHSKSILTAEDNNHFHPDYFKNKEWKAPDIEGNEISYALANYYFRHDNREIFDATLDGKLNIFPKIDFQLALNIAKKKHAS